MNNNQINYYSDGSTEPTGDDSYYNEREKENLTLKSIISANQKYDFKSQSKISVYKGRKYNAYNKIEDNIPFALLDKAMLSAEDFNKVTSHSPKEINSADKSGFLLKFILNLGLENYKGYRENIKDEDKSNLQKGLNYLSKTTKGVVNPIKKILV